MTARRPDPEKQVEDLEVPHDQSQQVKGGVRVATGDVNGDNLDVVDLGDGAAARGLPAVQKTTDVTLKRG